MKIYIVDEYSLDYDFVPSCYDDDEDEDVVQSIAFCGSRIAFTNKGDAEKWIASQEPEWDGQYEIEECELR